MLNKPYLFQVVLSLILCFIVGAVSARQIPLGLDGRKQIFVQEYWLEGSPSYCVANAGKVDQVIQVSRWQSQALAPLQLNEWDAPAGSVRCHDARQHLGEWLIDFRLQKGDRLGLLKAPKQAQGTLILPTVVSYQNLNAACAVSGMWMEQDRLWAKSGEPFSMVLHAALADGKIEFDKKGNQGQLPLLPLKKVTSTTFPVHMGDTSVVINVSESSGGQQSHRINLLFDIPQVSKPTMMRVSGRREISDQGWQCFVYGVMLEP